MAVLVGRYDAAAHAAVRTQRRRQVQRAAVVVPRAGADADVGLELAADGVLADQIDGRGRIAGAGQQAGRAPHDFHAVIDDGVDGRFAPGVARVETRRDAVIHVVADAETARTERIALAVIVLHRDAGRTGHHVGQRPHVFVFHALARHDGDRLRCLAQRQRQPGAGGGGARRVGTGAFRRGAVGIAHDLHAWQGGHPGFLRRRGGGRQGQE
ncbi:hypothetical protein D3C71_1369700 [compost metagenome]